ncbi:unnamed protein product [Miscanthus lutarioriparius]|uniref:DUF7910 domain-containing protein n=1 Tax=Miscanthus lutarioriparius TaxID=422564 RepID=A0A811MYU4_9POAL|nr:unnamed protein product [Miscanthus lutarioriparius]
MDGMHMGCMGAVARAPRRRCLPLLVAAAIAVACWWCAGMNTCVAAAPTTPPIRAVNLGGWLVVEGWIKPSPFGDIPNNVLLDGTQIFLKSSRKNAYWSATGGGGGAVVVGKQTEASSWETFKIWRRPGATDSIKFRLRVLGGGGQFVGIAKDGRTVVAAETDPRNETPTTSRSLPMPTEAKSG